jgi:hypothetical protein
VISTGILPGKALALLLCAEAKETSVKVKVECFAGRKGDERPVRFNLRERDYIVEEVLDNWDGPDGTFFKVLADGRNLYILRRRTTGGADEWTLQSIGPQGH